MVSPFVIARSSRAKAEGDEAISCVEPICPMSGDCFVALPPALNLPLLLAKTAFSRSDGFSQ